MKKYKQIDGFCLNASEELLIKYILPEYYIDKNIDGGRVSIDYAIRFLQNELNSIISSFVNGGFSRRGFIFYPFVMEVSKDNIEKIERLKKIAFFLNNNGYDFSSSLESYKGSIGHRDFAAILSALYHDLPLEENDKAVSVKKPKCRELETCSYKKTDSEYLRPLDELKAYANANLREYLSGFYLHGSLATKDYIKGWSDIDTLAVISKETIKNPEALLELRRKLYNMRDFLYRIDPLQHHGSIVISEYDVENYCQAYFPVVLFRYSKSFFSKERIVSFKVRDYGEEALGRLFWFVNYFRKLNAEKNFNPGSYDTKALLHSITLFPALYLQAKGILVYKKFSFDIARRDFKKDVWEVVDNVSSIRYNWKGTGTFPLMRCFSKINPLLAYHLGSRCVDLFKDIKKYNKIDVGNIVKSMLMLSEDAWGKIKEDVKSKKL